MSNIKSVLLVCTGNSCRSVMAEGLFKKYLKELGKTGITVRSAGIGAMDGIPPTAETIEVMKKEGVDMSDFSSTRLTDEHIKNADLILVMEEMHRYEVVRRVPEACSKTYLLKKYGKDDLSSHPEGFSVPDPIGRPLKDYERCLTDIKSEIKRIVELL